MVFNSNLTLNKMKQSNRAVQAPATKKIITPRYQEIRLELVKVFLTDLMITKNLNGIYDSFTSVYEPISSFKSYIELVKESKEDKFYAMFFKKNSDIISPNLSIVPQRQLMFAKAILSEESYNTIIEVSNGHDGIFHSKYFKPALAHVIDCKLLDKSKIMSEAEYHLLNKNKMNFI